MMEVQLFQIEIAVVLAYKEMMQLLQEVVRAIIIQDLQIRVLLIVHQAVEVEVLEVVQQVVEEAVAAAAAEVAVEVENNYQDIYIK
jgi:hypothetical protein